MYPKELVILVGKHTANHLIQKDCSYYRFYIVKDGILKQEFPEKKRKETTKVVYETIFAHFLKNKKLISVAYDTFQMTSNTEEYIGLKLQNNEEEKLSIFFTSKALNAFTKLEQSILSIKMRDFYLYTIDPIEKDIVERMVLRPSSDERSSVLYIRNNLRYNLFHIQKQLGYYYKKIGNKIDESDLCLLFSIIRYFINQNLENNPNYEYKQNSQKTSYHLRIHCNLKSYIEIIDDDLIREIEKSRILDDLWLLQHALIEKMPLQEDSIASKEELKRKRRKYLENFSQT